MSKAKLGNHITIDVQKLLETRMLIQANSGGGKSYAVRKFLEETHGRAQQIVLDMEGEFGTLREKYDFVLAGKGGDLEANPRSAELLARKVLELEVSLIVDLYELKKPDRIRFVRNFIDALVNAPKELWHPVLVVIDEAHVFAPEKGESEAAGAVIDLATRGRKRGFAAILATQRLSKLNKDVAAECLNKLIGRTSLDIDRKRAADELGFLTQKDSLTLRNLKPGHFYTFGPAIHDEVILGSIDPVKTTHPRAGQRLGFKRTKPTAHIKAVLKKLTDLPKEAEAELRDREALQRRIRELETELRKKPAAPKVAGDPKEVERAVSAIKAQAAKHILRLNRTIADAVSPLVKETIEAVSGVAPPAGKSYLRSTAGPEPRRAKPVSPPAPESARPRQNPFDGVGGHTYGACERKILGFLASKPGQAFTKVQIGAMTGYRHSSGGFNNSLSKLTQADLIHRNGGLIAINEEADVSAIIDSVPHRLEDWVAKLGACERAIYQFLLENPSTGFPKEEIGAQTNYSAGSGGFNNSISRLNTLGLIKRDRDGLLRLNPEVQNL